MKPVDLKSPEALAQAWATLYRAERQFAFEGLSTGGREILLGKLDTVEIVELLGGLDPAEGERLLALLADDARARVEDVLARLPPRASSVMHCRFACLRPEMTVDEAIEYFRRQAHSNAQSIYYAYVLDADRKLLGVVAFRQLFLGSSETRVRDVMNVNVLRVRADAGREELDDMFTKYGLLAMPVVDADGRMLGLVTASDIVTRVRDDATEDIQKLGGSEALGAPYLQIALPVMIKKRAGWLLALFVGEMLTATAMGYFEHAISRAVVLALFIPLIISSGGNSGSQATTLIIRAMALGEVRLRDWWRVLGRELSSGLALGLILGFVGLVRIMLWPARATLYGEHYVLVAITVALSLVGIVLWGTLAGSMLPFILRRLGFDPASASAPFVATLVDVTGLIIYFSVASLVLHGTLL